MNQQPHLHPVDDCLLEYSRTISGCSNIDPIRLLNIWNSLRVDNNLRPINITPDTLNIIDPNRFPIDNPTLHAPETSNPPLPLSCPPIQSPPITPAELCNNHLIN